MRELNSSVFFVVAGYDRPQGGKCHRIISPHFASKKEATDFVKDRHDLPPDLKIWRYLDDRH